MRGIKFIMVVQTIPDAVLAKHPEMAQVFDALLAYSEGRKVTARCPKCAHVLAVTEVPEVGARWVTCDTGCTSYREKYEPESPQAA